MVMSSLSGQHYSQKTPDHLLEDEDDDHGMTLTYFTAVSNLLTSVFLWSAGWQLDMYTGMFIYINGYLPICQLICHPEYI